MVRMQIGAATVENSMELPQNIGNKTALWPNNSTFENVSKETWNTNTKKYMHPYVHCSIISHSQDLEAAQVSNNRWLDKKKLWYIFTVNTTRP